MTRCAIVLFVAILPTIKVVERSSAKGSKPETWYEQSLGHINPDNINFGAIWEERKRAMIERLGNRWFQYSFATTSLMIVLLTLLCVQHLSHQRSLNIAAQAIADIVRHDQYSRRVAQEAIHRYNEHIEVCNRALETKQDGLSKSTSDTESELQRVRQELVDTRAENRGLRDELARKQKLIMGTTSREETDQEASVQAKRESSPGYLAARIDALEKQLRAEQRKNQQGKGTSVHDHRA